MISQNKSRTLAGNLQKLLDAKVGERAGLAPFVKRFPQVLRAAVMPHEGGTVRGVSEFRLGSELRADFVLLKGFSGGFVVTMVELEPATATLLKKDGSMTQRFNHAVSQVQQWKEFIGHRSKGRIVALELERQFREREVLAPWLRGQNPFDNTALFPLSHEECCLYTQYVIVIGRRSLSVSENARKRTLREGLIEVVSWDRLLDAARCFLPNGKPASPERHKLSKQVDLARSAEFERVFRSLNGSLGEGT
jgi:hypothetical protein